MTTDTLELKDLILSFNLTTQRLQETHAALQAQVGRLQHELAEANEQLRRSRSLAALGEMAAGIAHEVRNPLGSIQLYVQLLADDLADRPPQRELCDRIGRAVTGLDAVVRDVLAFARETIIRPAATTAGELFDRALEACAGLLRESGTEVVRGPGADCALHADVSLVQQALGNVVRNAIEAMVERGAGERRLLLDAQRRSVRRAGGVRESRVVLAVQDTGPGVPAEALPRMFNPFFTTRATGTGLGLAIVHRIVDAHGGAVSVSNPPEGGARVELALPPRPAPARSESRRTLPGAATATTSPNRHEGDS